MMLAYSKEANADIILNNDYNKAPYFGGLTYCAYEINVLGDPALSVWTDTPREFTTLPEYTATATEFTMKTPPLTWVALCDAAGTILTTQLTGLSSTADSTIVNIADSTCRINDTPYKQYVAANPTGKMKVKIKAHNYIAVEKEITLSTGIAQNTPGSILGINRIYASGKTVSIQYTLSRKAAVTISLFDVKGALIKTLLHRSMDAGINRNAFTLSGIGNGVYYCKVKAGAEQRAEKLVITK